MKWIIDWRIEGSIEIEARNANEAQEIFDKRFGEPTFLKPDRDGEISNDPPYRVDGQPARRKAGRHD